MERNIESYLSDLNERVLDDLKIKYCGKNNIGNRDRNKYGKNKTKRSRYNKLESSINY